VDTLDRAGRTLALAEAAVSGADPLRLIRRGWSITRTDTGDIVRSTAHLAPGDRLRTVLADGVVESQVTQVHSDGEGSADDD
jgi:exodeoxyribonuclease VII large subunit